MALIKRADADTALHRKVTLDLGDLARRAALMREAAEAEAARILAAAHEERRRLLDGAAEEGRRQGFAEGRGEGLEAGRTEGHAAALAECRGRLEEIEKAWAASVETFERERETILVESRREVIELAVAIAERVVHRVIEVEPGVIEDQLRELLALVAAPTTLIVRIHPEDEPLVAEALPALRERLIGGIHVRLVADSSVGRGSCTARTLGGASIDATVGTQLDRLVRELLPERARPARGGAG